MQVSPLNAALMINNIQYITSSDSNMIVQLIRMMGLSFLALYPANQEFALCSQRLVFSRETLHPW